MCPHKCIEISFVYGFQKYVQIKINCEGYSTDESDIKLIFIAIIWFL